MPNLVFPASPSRAAKQLIVFLALKSVITKASRKYSQAPVFVSKTGAVLFYQHKYKLHSIIYKIVSAPKMCTTQNKSVKPETFQLKEIPLNPLLFHGKEQIKPIKQHNNMQNHEHFALDLKQ